MYRMYRKSLGKTEKMENIISKPSARDVLLSSLACFSLFVIALKAECLNRHTVLLPEDSCNAQSTL